MNAHSSTLVVLRLAKQTRGRLVVVTLLRARRKVESFRSGWPFRLTQPLGCTPRARHEIFPEAVLLGLGWTTRCILVCTRMTSRMSDDYPRSTFSFLPGSAGITGVFLILELHAYEGARKAAPPYGKLKAANGPTRHQVQLSECLTPPKNVAMTT